jgi:hypothetical protein
MFSGLHSIVMGTAGRVRPKLMACPQATGPLQLSKPKEQHHLHNAMMMQMLTGLIELTSLHGHRQAGLAGSFTVDHITKWWYAV